MAKIVNLPAKDAPEALAALRDALASDAAAVETLITARLAGGAELIPEIGTHIIAAGGKRLRPLLTLAAARIADYRGAHHIELAAAVEFMHTATLLHDDVVDDSDLRRGAATARTLWGNAASVLVGDYLLGQAFMLMVDADNLDSLRVLSAAAATIAEGEVMQLAALKQVEASEDRYMRVIEAKTAALFAAAMQVGGLIGAATPQMVESLRSFGHNLGIAFQLIDDVLDYGGSATATGKEIGDDFREGKVTLPLVLAFRRGDEAERDFWRRIIAAPSREAAELTRAISYMRQHAALSDTVLRAVHYGDKAKDALALLPPSDMHKCLTDLVDFCIARAR